MDNLRRYQLALEIGEEAARQGKWQQALTCFRTALNGLPHEARVYCGLGDAHLALADPERALANYREAARLAPDDPAYPERIAAMQLSRQQTEEAARSFLVVGDRYWKNDEPFEAAARWHHVLQLTPDSVAAHERLAMFYHRQENADAAVEHYLALAEIFFGRRRCQAALHICCTALDIAPDNLAVWSLTEHAWRCIAVNRKVEGNGDLTLAPSVLVKAAGDFAQWQLALNFRQSTLNTRNDREINRDTLLNQALLLEARGYAGRAIRCYEQAIAAGLDLPAGYFTLGQLYHLVVRYEDARMAFTLAARHPFYARAVSLLPEYAL